MVGVNFIIQDLIAGEGLAPNEKEVSQREVPLLRRLHMDGAAGVVSVQRVHARQADTDVGGNFLRDAIDDYLQVRMNVKLGSHVRSTAGGHLTGAGRGGVYEQPLERVPTQEDNSYDDQSADPEKRRFIIALLFHVR